MGRSGLPALAFGLCLATGCERAVPTRPSAELTIDPFAAASPQSAVVGTAVPVAPAVRVRDATGRPVAGARVVFTPLGGRGLVTGAEVDTDVNGVASVGSWTLSTAAGAHELSVILTSSTSTAQLVFTATAVPGPVTGIAVSPTTASVAPGDTRALVASTIDRFGNVVTAGVSATFTAVDPSIASVSSTGVVSGVTVGVTRIAVTFGAFTRDVWSAVGSRPTGASVGSSAIGQGAYGIAASAADLLYVGAESYVARFALPSESSDTPLYGVSTVPAIAFSPNGTTAYVGSFSGYRLHIVDVGANVILRSLVVSSPTRIIASPDGAYIYVTTYDGDLIRISTANDSMSTLRLGGRLNGMAISGTQSALYATNVEGTVFDVNPATFTQRLSRSIAGAAQGIAVSLDGTRLFVANEAGELQVLDATTLSRRRTVAAANGGFDLALTRDGSQLYVTQSAQDQVTVIDADTYAVLRTIPMTFPRYIAFNVRGTLGFVTNGGGGTVYFLR